MLMRSDVAMVRRLAATQRGARWDGRTVNRQTSTDMSPTLDQRITDAKARLDVHVREIVAWHHQHRGTGTLGTSAPRSLHGRGAFLVVGIGPGGFGVLRDRFRIGDRFG